MNPDELAKHLADPSRIGLTEELVEKLELASEPVTQAKLEAQIEPLVARARKASATN